MSKERPHAFTEILTAMRSPSRIYLALAVLAALLPYAALIARAQMVTGRRMTDFDKVFGLDRNPSGDIYSAQLAKCSVPGSILWPGDRATFTIRVDNRRDAPLEAAGKLFIVAYGTKGKPGDVWTPTVIKLGDVGEIPVNVRAAPKASDTLTVTPDIPARFGAYALVLDLGPQLRRQFVA